MAHEVVGSCPWCGCPIYGHRLPDTLSPYPAPHQDTRVAAVHRTCACQEELHETARALRALAAKAGVPAVQQLNVREQQDLVGAIGKLVARVS